jgi:hypothetical protein
MLLGNHTLFSRNPLRYWGVTLQGPRGNWNQSGPLRNSTMGYASIDFTTTRVASIPSGATHPIVWMMSNKGGGIASRNSIEGAGSLIAVGIVGYNAVSSITGSGDLTGLGSLVAALAAAIGGNATLSGILNALINALANVTGAGDAVGAMTATANLASNAIGAGALSLNISAFGNLTADITVSGTLTASQIADEILDNELVELGLTVREALRLIAAATAGKVSISGGTVTIRNAVADTDDRIVATTDGAGQRTAITYDLS